MPSPSRSDSRSRHLLTRLAGCVATLGLLFAACGTTGGPPPSAAWQDPSYRRSATTLVSVAILPVPQTGPTADRVDQGLEQAFAAVNGMQLRGRPYEVRQAMNASHRLVVWADKIQAQRFDANELAHGPSLSTILTPKELEDLHSTLNANILLVPTPFDLQNTPKNVSGHAGYRAYELPTGRLLRQNNFAVAIPEGGEAGEKKATVELVLQIETDFEKHLL